MKFASTILGLCLVWGASPVRSCYPADILVGGSSDEQPLVQKWVEGYKSWCPDTNLVLEEVPCSSSCGARRVCSAGETAYGETPLDVGTLSRPWRELEATSNNGYLYQCVASDRLIISIDAAMYALAFAVGTGGVAHYCIEILGGLTLDQMRWIFSNYTREDLIDDGWDPESLKDDDMDDNTHLWSELDARCANEEILISGGPFMSADHQFVGVELFGDNFEYDHDEDIPINPPRKTGPNTHLEYFTGGPTSLEDFATATTNTKESDPYKLAQYVRDNGAAITFMKYPFALENSDIITLVPIQNKYGSMVDPSYTSILSEDYHPFARMMHINMIKNEDTLRAMKGFFEFAYSAEGKKMVEECGYFPLAEWEEKVMLSVLDADDETWGDFNCSSSTSMMEIAGSRSAYPVAKIWADVYRAKCNLDVKVRAGGSHRGSDRVCGTAAESSVDIGTMSRDFVSSEAVTTNGYEYECVGSGNKVIQIETSIEALVVATKEDGVADKCISQLGGLTTSQLRWIFSSLTEDELRSEGWSFDTIPNSDGNDATHLWSELLDHPDCPSTEIKISGSADDTTFLDFFSEEILPSYGDGEDFATNRTDGFFQSENESELVQYLIDNGDAISFFSYSYFADHDDMIVGVKLMNEDDEFVEPLRTSIEDGSYTLSRRIYLNVLDSPETLAKALPFLEMGLSDMGAELVRFTGYVPIPKTERVVMKARIRAASGVDIDHLECGPALETISMAGSTSIYDLAKLFGEIYEIGCDVKVQIDGGGSAAGADRVCGGGVGTPVDIGLMSRDWHESEGIKDGMNIQCNDWDKTRRSIQIKIASTAIALATSSSGDAKECIDILGGLTKDQLRWIFSSYDEKQLQDSGWNPSSLANPDFDSSTHLWSELHSNCAATEILIAGPSDLAEDVYYDFMDLVLDDRENGEEISWDNRPNKYVTGGSDSAAVSFLLENGAAIAFFGFSIYKGNADSLSPVPIQNNANAFVIPHESTIQAGSYDWLSKSLYMNLNNDVETLPSTIPLIRLGVSDSGATLVEAAGYVPVVQEQREQILATLCSTEGAPPSTLFCGEDEKGLSVGAIIGIVALVVAVVGVIAAVVVRKRNAKEPSINEDNNKSPYAESRINWAQQEATVEQTVAELNPQKNLRDVVIEEEIDNTDSIIPSVV